MQLKVGPTPHKHFFDTKSVNHDENGSFSLSETPTAGRCGDWVPS